MKDMRNKTCYLADYGDYVDFCRAHDTGLEIICISNYVKKESRTTATGRVPKVVHRKLGANDGVDVGLTASVAIGAQYYGIGPNSDAPRHY